MIREREERVERVGGAGHEARARRSSIVRPDRTDSGWVDTGLRRASAASSFSFTSSHFSRRSLPTGSG